MADTSPGVFIESLTWPEVEEALKAIDKVVIPLGARCKEHGLHLPLNTDWLMAEYLAKRIAEHCRVLILPTVQYGFYPAFVEYPGSVTIGEATFRDGMADICRSFARHGTRRFYILNTGISTLRPLKAAQELLRNEGVSMDFTDLRNTAVAEHKAAQEQPFGTHADELETSVMLYIAPEVVRLDRARPELSPDRAGGLTRDPAGKGIYSPTGAWGDPTLATREKGEHIVEAMVREIVEAINKRSGPQL